MKGRYWDSGRLYAVPRADAASPYRPSSRGSRVSGSDPSSRELPAAPRSSAELELHGPRNCLN
eukprot:4471788-Alexandrium_andersonii.AAC.1